MSIARGRLSLRDDVVEMTDAPPMRAPQAKKISQLDDELMRLDAYWRPARLEWTMTDFDR